MPPLVAGGRVYDLASVFADINARFFGGRLKVPITWGRGVGRARRGGLTFGSYDPVLGLIRIHPVLDRPGIPNYAEPALLLMSGLIKLRDLPDIFWNVDTLFILTATHEQARQLARIADEEDWAGEVQVVEDQQEIDRALGTGRDEYGLVTIWWD